MFKPVPSDKPIRVLAVALSTVDLATLVAVGGRKSWDVVRVGTLGEADLLGHVPGHTVILCNRDIPDSGWRQAIARLSAGAPRGCTLLVSTVSDSYLDQEVFLFGGAAVLTAPLREDLLTKAVEAAWAFKR